MARPSDSDSSRVEKPAVPEWLEWAATVAIFFVYFSYILAVAFAPATLGERVSEGLPLTWGMCGGVGVIAFSIVMAAWYTRRANRAERN